MIHLTRRAIDLVVDDVEAARDWVLARVDEEIRGKGQPLPRFILLASDFAEMLDLSAAFGPNPGASPGATLRSLRSRPHIRRWFVVVQAHGEDAVTGAERRFAMVFEELGGRWFLAQIEYQTDATTGLGLPIGGWQRAEVPDLAPLGPFLGQFAHPPPGAVALAIAPPGAKYAPDIRTRFGDLVDGVRSPADAQEMAGLALQIATADLLSGTVTGTVVVRLAGRRWECWVLGDDMPTTLDDMIRWIANERDPEADGVAVVVLAYSPDDVPPVPFLQVVAERDGQFSEGHGRLESPDGPAGRKVVTGYRWWPARPVAEDGMWLGVRAEVVLTAPPGWDAPAH